MNLKRSTIAKSERKLNVQQPKKEFIIKPVGPLGGILYGEYQRAEKIDLEEAGRLKKSQFIKRKLVTKESRFHNGQHQTFVPGNLDDQGVKDLFRVKNYRLPETADTSHVEIGRNAQSNPKSQDKDPFLSTLQREKRTSNPSHFFMPPIKKSTKQLIRVANETTQKAKTSTAGTAATLSCTGVHLKGRVQPEHGKDPMKVQQSKQKHITEQLELTTGEYLKDTRSYKLKDLDVDEDFLVETTLPYERVIKLLNNLQHDYSSPNLHKHREELYLILSQDYDEIVNSDFGVQSFSKDLIFICYNMLLFNLATEEQMFYNCIAIMLQGMDTILRNMRDEDEVVVICGKVFEIVKNIILTVEVSRHIVIQMFYNSFNRLSESFSMIPSSILKPYLLHIFDLFQETINQESQALEHNLNAFQNQGTYILPLKGFEEMLKINTIRNQILNDGEIKKVFMKFMSELNDSLLKTSFNKVAGTYKQLFIVLWFSVLFEAVKYHSLQIEMKFTEQGFESENLIKTVISLLFVSCKSGHLNEQVKLLFISIFNNASKLIQSIDTRMLTNDELKQQAVDDYDFNLKLFFKLHFDEDSRFVNPSNVDLCLAMVKFAREILQKHSEISKQNAVKKFKIEFSSIIKLYNHLEKQVSKLKQFDNDFKQLMNLLLDLVKL